MRDAFIEGDVQRTTKIGIDFLHDLVYPQLKRDLSHQNYECRCRIIGPDNSHKELLNERQTASSCCSDQSINSAGF